MMYRVPISDVQVPFANAHRNIMNISKPYDGKSLVKGRRWIADQWEKHYGIKPVASIVDGRWTHLDFPDEPSHTMFLLKWS